MSFWFKPQSTPPSQYMAREPSFDLSRLPSTPWKIEIDGKILVIRDACNEYVGEMKVDRKAFAPDIARFLEEATRK